MGVYEVSLTVPANTPEDAPVEKTLEIEGDVVTKVEFAYPAGCWGLVRSACFYGIKQLWPAEAGTWFTAENYTISFNPAWDLPEREVELTFKGWSEDDTWPHKLIFRVVTEDMPAAKPWKVLADFIAVIKKLIGV